MQLSSLMLQSCDLSSSDELRVDLDIDLHIGLDIELLQIAVWFVTTTDVEILQTVRTICSKESFQ